MSTTATDTDLTLETEADNDAMREALTELLPDARPVIIDKLVTMLQATKRARVERSCTKCGCRHIDYGIVNDSAAAERVLRLVWEYGKGKPRQMDNSDTGPQVVINRGVTGIDTALAPALAGHAQDAGLARTRQGTGVSQAASLEP